MGSPCQKTEHQSNHAQSQSFDREEGHVVHHDHDSHSNGEIYYCHNVEDHHGFAPDIRPNDQILYEDVDPKDLEQPKDRCRRIDEPLGQGRWFPFLYLTVY